MKNHKNEKSLKAPHTFEYDMHAQFYPPGNKKIKNRKWKDSIKHGSIKTKYQLYGQFLWPKSPQFLCQR